MTNIKQNRFRAGLPLSPSEVSRSVPTRGRQTEGLLGDLPPISTKGDVWAREMSAKDVKERFEKMRKAIYDTPNFTMAFREQLKDPIFAKAFMRFHQAVLAGHQTVANTSAEKVESSKVMYSYLEVATFLDEMVKTLEAMEKSKAEAPVDIASIGLQVMDRNAQVMQHADNPLQMAAVLKVVAGLEGLKADDREKFLTQLADAAIHHVNKQENRTDAGRKQALDALRSAIVGLVENGSQMKIINPYLKRAEDISKEQDGETGMAEQIRTIGILLYSGNSQVSTRAERSLIEHMNTLMDRRYERQKAGEHLTPQELEGFSALLTASQYSDVLYQKMPDVIEAITNHPKLADEARRAEEAAAAAAGEEPKADAAQADASDPAAAQVYTPAQEEIDTQQQMLTTFVGMLEKMYPDLSDADAKKAHLSLTQKANGLIIDGMNFDQSANIATQVRQLTRHPDAAMDAVTLIEVIPNQTEQLNAASAAVRSAIENRNLDAAYDLYHHPIFQDDDGQNTGRQADMLAATARAVLQTKGDLQGNRAAQAWAGSAHTLGVEQALKASPRNTAALKSILDLMKSDWEDWRPTPQASIEFVAQVQAQLKGDANYHQFTPVLVGILAKHETDTACMDQAKELLDGFRAMMEGVAQQPQINVNVNGQNVKVQPHVWFVELLGTLSENRTLSSFMRPLTETAFSHLQLASLAVPFAQKIPTLGKYGQKTMLARQLDSRLSQLTPIQKADIALTLAATPETHQQAREIIVDFTRGFEGQNVQELDVHARTSFMKVEAATRLAVPNILTGDALTGLFAGYKAGQVAKEVIELVPMYLPDDLIEKVLANFDGEDIRKIIADKRAAATEPEQTVEAPAAQE